MDEDMIERLDRLAQPGGKRHSNRSRIIRTAVREYISRLERAAEDEREAAIVRRHRKRLVRQAAALVRQQAKP
jgi:metal-responsive CopG/Arc/MetJ family transcriptional regulator